jgi:hypothetical protein
MNSNNIGVSQIDINTAVFFHLPMFSLFYFLHFREGNSLRMNISRAMRRNTDIGAIELPSYTFGVSKFESRDAENDAPFCAKTGTTCCEIKPSIIIRQRGVHCLFQEANVHCTKPKGIEVDNVPKGD